MTKTHNPDGGTVFALPIKDDAPARGFALHSIFTHPFGHSRPVFDAPNEGGGAPTPEPTPAPTPAPTPTPTPGGPTDEVAKLVRENMGKKAKIEGLEAQLALWEGLNPDDVRKLVADAAAAETKRQADELTAAEARGEFERVKAAMGEAHTKDLETARGETQTVRDELTNAYATINELTVGASFLNSQFIATNTVLPPSVARKEFGDHYEVQDGRPVAFDKPKGAKERTMLVDGAGKPLGFEASIAKLVEAHPDKERLLKGKMVPGVQSKTTDTTKVPSIADGDLKGSARIAAILAARKKS